MWTRLLGAGLLGAAALAGSGNATACGIDGVPSLLVNGHLVRLNTATPVKGKLATWTPFVAPGAYPSGQALRLGELRSRVDLTLPPGASQRPWRWLFGDGTTGRGFAVRHTHRRPGVYVVTVQFYLGAGVYARWYQFDATALHIRH